jgi:hypothetical protein
MSPHETYEDEPPSKTAQEALGGAKARPASTLAPQADPFGLSQHSPGAKLDLGKLRFELVLSDFSMALEAVVRVGTYGATKYTDHGWLTVPNGYNRYLDAQGRHRSARWIGELHDPETQMLHLAHEAWNTLAALELYLRAELTRTANND